MTLRDDLVRRLEQENDELRERIANLEELIGLRIEVPLVFGLTTAEAKMLGVLLKRELVSKEMAMTALYGLRTGGAEVEIKIIDVFVCKIRAKLKRFGIVIETVWGRGYLIPQASKAKVFAMLHEARAA